MLPVQLQSAYLVIIVVVLHWIRRVVSNPHFVSFVQVERRSRFTPLHSHHLPVRLSLDSPWSLPRRVTVTRTRDTVLSTPRSPFGSFLKALSLPLSSTKTPVCLQVTLCIPIHRYQSYLLALYILRSPSHESQLELKILHRHEVPPMNVITPSPSQTSI